MERKTSLFSLVHEVNAPIFFLAEIGGVCTLAATKGKACVVPLSTRMVLNFAILARQYFAEFYLRDFDK